MAKCQLISFTRKTFKAPSWPKGFYIEPKISFYCWNIANPYCYDPFIKGSRNCGVSFLSSSHLIQFKCEVAVKRHTMSIVSLLHSRCGHWPSLRQPESPGALCLVWWFYCVKKNTVYKAYCHEKPFRLTAIYVYFVFFLHTQFMGDKICVCSPSSLLTVPVLKKQLWPVSKGLQIDFQGRCKKITS